MEIVACPGCEARLERVDGLALDRPMLASPECWRVCGEVTGFEFAHPWLVGQCHQMTVDAYGAQHAGAPTRPIRVAYSLVGLHLALDMGLPGAQVRNAHARMGKPDPTWPAFERPTGFAGATVVDVARAGLHADSPQGHADAVRTWASAVWAWWEPSHRDVEALARVLLGPGLAGPS